MFWEPVLLTQGMCGFVSESTTVCQRCIAGAVPTFLREERNGEVVCREVQHGHISLCEKKYK